MKPITGWAILAGDDLGFSGLPPRYTYFSEDRDFLQASVDEFGGDMQVVPVVLVERALTREETMKTENKIKTCPFCGKQPRLYDDGSVFCGCDASPSGRTVEQWNRRTPDLEWLEVGVNNLTKYGCDSATIGYNTALQDIADLIRRKEGK